MSLGVSNWKMVVSPQSEKLQECHAGNPVTIIAHKQLLEKSDSYKEREPVESAGLILAFLEPR